MRDITFRLKTLVGKGETEIVISELDVFLKSDNRFYNQITLISASYSNYKMSITLGLKASQELSIDIAKINNAILELIDNLPEDWFKTIKLEIESAIKKYLKLKNEMKTENSNDYIDVFQTLDQYKNTELFTPHANEVLAYLYQKGLGTKANSEIAFNLYKKSAEQGFAWGQFGLAEMCLIQGDYTEGFNWFKKAADQNLGWAYQRIGDIYRDALGVKRDTNKALEYYIKSASHGVDWGYACMGDFFLNGTETIEKDLNTAKIMYEKAKDLGNEHAKRRLSKITQ